MRATITTALLLTTALVQAQAPAPVKYEVASIKSSPPEARGGSGRPEPGGRRYRGLNLTLKLYIASAYRLKPDQIGGPGWVDSDRFDIEAQAEKPSTLEEHHQMLRSLLADRFHLRFHFDTKEMPIYALTVDSGGAKLTLHDAANSGEAWLEQGNDAPFHAKWTATSASMELFAFRLASVMDRPVIDQTGLKGGYDFKLTYTQDLPPNISPTALLNGQPFDVSGPTIFPGGPPAIRTSPRRSQRPGPNHGHRSRRQTHRQLTHTSSPPGIDTPGARRHYTYQGKEIS